MNITSAKDVFLHVGMIHLFFTLLTLHGQEYQKPGRDKDSTCRITQKSVVYGVKTRYSEYAKNCTRHDAKPYQWIWLFSLKMSE